LLLDCGESLAEFPLALIERLATGDRLRCSPICLIG
jgi:hypothetical protein